MDATRSGRGSSSQERSDPDAILGRVSASAKGLFTAEGALVAALLLLVLGIVHAAFRA